MTGMLVVAALLTGISAPASDFRAGAASATVNPAGSVFLAGHDLNRKSTGIHDDLFAKAVVFANGAGADASAVALVVVDSISLQYDTVCEIRRRAAAKVSGLALPAERVIVQATHTHCAPDTIGMWGPDEVTCGRDGAYMEQLTETAATVVARAAQNLRDATVRAASAARPEWVTNDSEKDVLEPDAAILQVVDKDGKTIATLTNLACHPAVLDTDTFEISADWCAAFYKDMAAALPGEHVFVQGAIGCWVQPNTPERTFALCDKYGQDLAAKVLAALQEAKPLDDTTIRFAHKPFEMPQANVKFQLAGELGLTTRKFAQTVTTEVAWFAIGPAQFATHPGETAPGFSLETKALMDTGPKFILGLGLDHLGYICPPAYFTEGNGARFSDYLTSMSPGRDAGPSMMEALRAIIP